MIRPLTSVVVLTVSFIFGSFAQADEVARFLQMSPLPHGVVFEIVESDEDRLSLLLPKVKEAIRMIKATHAETEFAVVSHGREEFALQSKNQQKYAEIHQSVKSLVAADVPVHVCETHASWYGVSAEDFPDYVNVAPTGPGQINLYLELGYHLIVIE
jgi:intracellular sulfur oxidation DsrE/DsrF family protein